MRRTMPESLDDRYDQFLRLFSRSENAVRAHVRTLAWSSMDVDDVMQEVALAAWRKFEDFDAGGGGEAFTKWLLVIARFEVLRARRNVARDRLVLSEEVITLLADDSRDRAEAAAAERAAVSECLQKFDEAGRRLLLVVHTPGRTVAEIAAETGTKARAMYSRLEALRARLRACVQGRLAAGEAS